MPQSSRTIGTLRGCCSQRATSARRSWACTGSANSALLASSSIDRNGGSRRKREVHGVAPIYLYHRAGGEVQGNAPGHAGGGGGVQGDRLVVDRHEALVAARKRDRVGAVVPPVIDVAARHHMPKAHHLEDRRIAVLADPLAGRGGLEAGRTGHRQGPAVCVRRWAE